MPFTVSVEDVAGPEGFVASVTVNNEIDPIAQGVGKTKKEAKRMAADNAVHILMHLDAVSHSSSLFNFAKLILGKQKHCKCNSIWI